MLRVGHHCGLFNRVDVIVTGYVLADMQGEQELEVLWPLNDRHMPVSFHALFTGLPRGRVLEEEIDREVAQRYARDSGALPADYRRSRLYRDMLQQLLAKAVPEVRDEVEGFVAAHFGHSPGAKTIGVHVRRSEAPRPLCPEAQPLRYYEAVMKSFPSETRFFISTDSQEAFRWLKSRFGDRVFQRPKVHDDRSSVAGVREGFIDMLLLSRCEGIIGTFGSSFSGTAALVGDVPIMFVKAVPELDARWSHFDRWRWWWAYRHVVVETTMWRRWYLWVVKPQLARVGRIPARLRRLVRGDAVASST